MKPPRHPGEREMNPPRIGGPGEMPLPRPTRWTIGESFAEQTHEPGERRAYTPLVEWRRDRGAAGGSGRRRRRLARLASLRRDRRGRWEERALAAEAIGREQQLDALEDRQGPGPHAVDDARRAPPDRVRRSCRVRERRDRPAPPLDTRNARHASCPSRCGPRSRRAGNAARPTSVLVETGVPTRWLRGTITPAADGATLVVVRDVTQQRQLDSVRRDFVANASHELKTPAATIQAAAETLRQVVRGRPRRGRPGSRCSWSARRSGCRASSPTSSTSPGSSPGAPSTTWSPWARRRARRRSASRRPRARPG